jgi:hypothetical protein
VCRTIPELRSVDGPGGTIRLVVGNVTPGGRGPVVNKRGGPVITEDPIWICCFMMYALLAYMPAMSKFELLNGEHFFQFVARVGN